MKWSLEQKEKLRTLCVQGKLDNKDLADHFGVPVTEIHAMRSRMGITIPKCRAAQGNPAIAVNPDFEKALPPVTRKGLSKDVKKAFSTLQDAILLAMANNGTSLEDSKTYNCLGQTLSAIEEAYGGLIGDASI